MAYPGVLTDPRSKHHRRCVSGAWRRGSCFRGLSIAVGVRRRLAWPHRTSLHPGPHGKGRSRPRARADVPLSSFVVFYAECSCPWSKGVLRQRECRPSRRLRAAAPPLGRQKQEAVAPGMTRVAEHTESRTTLRGRPGRARARWGRCVDDQNGRQDCRPEPSSGGADSLWMAVPGGWSGWLAAPSQLLCGRRAALLVG